MPIIPQLKETKITNTLKTHTKEVKWAHTNPHTAKIILKMN